MKLKIYSLDVWGNETDGFEVNDRFPAGTIESDATTDDAETILNLLVENWYMSRLYAETCDVDESDETTTYISDEKGRPVYEVERVS